MSIEEVAPTAAPPRPYLSLEMICGDAHAGAALKRCLTSVLVRTGGPLVDEVGLTFNGGYSGFVELQSTLMALGYARGGKLGWPTEEDRREALDTVFHLDKLPPLTLRIRPWPGRFDTARNDGWKHARGEWVLYLDGDDVVADAGTPEGLKAIAQVEKDYGLPPLPPGAPTTTLKTFLAQLPGHINVVYAPYDYAVDANDYVVVRQKVKRIVRRSAGHIWHSPEQSGVHEILVAPRTAETMAETFGFLVQHHPTQDEVVRVKRNREIVAQMTQPGVLSDPRHAYDVANAALSAGELAKANEAIGQAIIHAYNDMDRYVYRLGRAFIKMVEGNTEGMLNEAFAAIGILPELRDGYFIACEAFYRLGKWRSVIEWYERGACKTPTLLSRDQPLAAFTAPRAQAAMAYTHLGQWEKALECVDALEREYPLAGLTIEVAARVRESVAQQRGEAALFAAVEFLLSVSPQSAYIAWEALNHTHTFDILRSTLAWKTLEQKILATTKSLCRVEIVEGAAAFPDKGLLNLDDILDADVVEQIISAEFALDNRSAKVVTRERKCRAPTRIAFYAPVGITRWECSELDTAGMGGSESSVAHLAKELVDLGHNVTVFTNKPGYAVTSLWQGVVQKDCSQYRAAEWGGDAVVVFCRAPWMVRENPPKTPHVFCWHQDNGYANHWMWSRETVDAQQHLFVSEFARKSLLSDADVSDARGVILGNGISPTCVPGTAPRKPGSVVYASNPTRGLEHLLRAWPLVLADAPTAHLTVLCEWRVMLATLQDEPGFPPVKRLQALQAMLANSPNTTDLGWQPQKRVIEVLQESEVYAYPGGPMPEGFGVALVQAQACGCLVVAPKAGALPEVLGPSTHWVNAAWEPPQLSRAILSAFVECRERRPSDETWHYWPSVAQRFLHAVGVTP